MLSICRSTMHVAPAPATQSCPVNICHGLQHLMVLDRMIRARCHLETYLPERTPHQCSDTMSHVSSNMQGTNQYSPLKSYRSYCTWSRSPAYGRAMRARVDGWYSQEQWLAVPDRVPISVVHATLRSRQLSCLVWISNVKPRTKAEMHPAHGDCRLVSQPFSVVQTFPFWNVWSCDLTLKQSRNGRAVDQLASG